MRGGEGAAGGGGTGDVQGRGQACGRRCVPRGAAGCRRGPRPPEPRRGEGRGAPPGQRCVGRRPSIGSPLPSPLAGPGLPQSQLGWRPQRRAGRRDGLGRDPAGRLEGGQSPSLELGSPGRHGGTSSDSFPRTLPASGTEARRPDSPSPFAVQPARASALHCTVGSTQVSLAPSWACSWAKSQAPLPPPPTA